MTKTDFVHQAVIAIMANSKMVGITTNESIINHAKKMADTLESFGYFFDAEDYIPPTPTC